MNQLESPDAEQRTDPFQFSLRSLLLAISLLAAAIALVRFNVLLYQHARFLEYQYQDTVTLEYQYKHEVRPVRPWLWPEDALELFMPAWVLTLIASSVAVFRVRDKLLKYEAGFFAAGALVAMVVNAYFLLIEAFNF